MKLQNLSVRAFLRKIVAGTLLTAALLLLIFFLLTKDVRVVICGIILTSAFYIWGMVFLHYFQKKLSLFTDGLCQTLDHMMDSTDWPQVDYEAETLLSRISHRLERLYNVMQKTRHTAEGEKEELQSLVSDISHQTKTPIANLKLINDTMLTRPLTEEKRKEFLQATGTQLDKLDFLIQGMVKTSRLETGVITLEKQDAVIGDTLVSAINGVLEKKKKKMEGNYPVIEDNTYKYALDKKKDRIKGFYGGMPNNRRYGFEFLVNDCGKYEIRYAIRIDEPMVCGFFIRKKQYDSNDVNLGRRISTREDFGDLIEKIENIKDLGYKHDDGGNWYLGVKDLTPDLRFKTLDSETLFNLSKMDDTVSKIAESITNDINTIKQMTQNLSY